MTTKRTHGPCNCSYAATHEIVRDAKHYPDCPSIYPAQREPDALTRLVRWVRAQETHIVTEEAMFEALALISEAREEQRKARRTVLSEADATILKSAEPPAFFREHHSDRREYEAATGGYAVGVNHALDTIRAMLKDPAP